MKRLLVTLMVMFSVLLTSCGESNNAASSSDSQASTTSSSSISASSVATSTAFDGTEEMAQELLMDWLTVNPLDEGEISLIIEEGQPVIARTYYQFMLYYDDYWYSAGPILVDKETGEMFLYESNGNIMPLDEHYRARQTEIVAMGNNSVSPEEAEEILLKFLYDAGYTLAISKSFGDVYEADGRSYYQFMFSHHGGDFVSTVAIVDTESGELYAANPKDMSMVSLQEWMESQGLIGGHAMGYEGDMPMGDSQPIAATDLLGKWIWESNYHLDRAAGKSTLRQITFLSNGTCNGGVALKYNPEFGTSDTGDMIVAEYWEFLEYEQIIQLTGKVYEYSGGIGDFNAYPKNRTANFNVVMVDGVLYLENTNDASSGSVQYNKAE